MRCLLFRDTLTWLPNYRNALSWACVTHNGYVKPLNTHHPAVRLLPTGHWHKQNSFGSGSLKSPSSPWREGFISLQSSAFGSQLLANGVGGEQHLAQRILLRFYLSEGMSQRRVNLRQEQVALQAPWGSIKSLFFQSIGSVQALQNVRLLLTSLEGAARACSRPLFLPEKTEALCHRIHCQLKN